MQLRNRLVKADFWTDSELALKLNPTGRMFYQGLWQLAEDSGVIEADPAAFKMILFPMDDINLEKINNWIDNLINLDKLIPFSKGKKEYYYIRNFHKHQSLRSPGKPELPLPDWIIYVGNDKKRQSGGYIIDYELMPKTDELDHIVTVGNVTESVLKEYEHRKDTLSTPKGDRRDSVRSEEKENTSAENPRDEGIIRTESVRSPNGNPTVTNKNLNLNKNLNKKENNTSSLNDNSVVDGNSKGKKEQKTVDDEEEEEEKPVTNENNSQIPDAFHKAFNQMISPFQMEMLQSYIEDGVDEEAVILALKQAAIANANSLSYVKKILDDWLEKGVRTEKEARMAIKEHASKVNNNGQDPPKKKELEELYKAGYQ